MVWDKMRKNAIAWYGVLNGPEARVLSATEERALLVELVDCKHRILEDLTRSGDASGDRSDATADFQQLIRDLANPQVTSRHRSAGEVRRLADRYREIRSALAMANVRLVAHVAKRYQDRGIPPGDLIQEGFCALLVAIDRFDVLNQSRLSTYAIWWIRQAIQRAVASEAYPVRLNPRQLHRLALAGGMKGRGDHTARADKPRPALSPTMTKLFAATRPVRSLDALSRCDDTTCAESFSSHNASKIRTTTTPPGRSATSSRT